MIGWHTLDGDQLDDSTLGFRIGGGIIYPMGGSLVANAGLNYSSADFDIMGFSFDVDALIIELGLGVRL